MSTWPLHSGFSCESGKRYIIVAIYILNSVNTDIADFPITGGACARGRRGDSAAGCGGADYGGSGGGCQGRGAWRAGDGGHSRALGRVRAHGWAVRWSEFAEKENGAATQGPYHRQ